MNRALRFLLICLILLPLTLFAQTSTAPIVMPGLIAPVQVVRDANGIAHIRANYNHDLAFMQGWIHAQDRLFQMDFNRRAASGKLAELLGPAALAQDVQARTLGMHRAAQRSLPLLSPRLAAMLQAYADGVNAYVASHALPPEYAALKLSHFDPWTPYDTMCVSKVLGYYLSFDLSDISNTVALLSYQEAGAGLGFNGAALFFEDLFRTAPFYPVFTIPDALSTQAVAAASAQRTHGFSATVSPEAVELGKRFLKQQAELPKIPGLPVAHGGASNAWAISGKYTQSGAPLVANDPHLEVGIPSIWYPIHLSAGKIDVTGGSLAGTPLVVVGHNRNVEWGFTNAPLDVTDVYQEQVVPDMTSPSGLSTMYNGAPEWIMPIPEVFRANMGGTVVTVPPGNGIPQYTMIVPRRNNGPLIAAPDEKGHALSVQWTGFSGTHEFEAILRWNESRSLQEFQTGLNYFNCPLQNVMVADNRGNIGSFIVGDLPVREDLQAMTVNGAPPYFIRSGTGGNEWLAVQHRQTGQGIDYEIIPQAEMPHVVNPPAGYIVAANNDPVGVTANNQPISPSMLRPGGGFYYLGAFGFSQGFRAARIQQLLKARLPQGKVTALDMKIIQADVKAMDASFFVPFISQAFTNASRTGAPDQLATLAANTGVAEAVTRLRAWNFTTPTGLAEGFDAFDKLGQLNTRSTAEISNSVAASLYYMWRSQFISSVIDSKLDPYGLPRPDDRSITVALRHLFDTFDANQGFGVSGLNFFPITGVSSAADRRDIYILKALADALTALSGPDFAKAFNGSTQQDDYRWGKLHRIVLKHTLGSVFDVPPAGAAFPPPLLDLDGIPVDGGYQTVDVANCEGDCSLRATNADSFMWTHGPSERYVGEALPSGVKGATSLPGGVSGNIMTPFYVNLLPGWLVNDTYDQLFGLDEVMRGAVSVTKYVPSL